MRKLPKLSKTNFSMAVISGVIPAGKEIRNFYMALVRACPLPGANSLLTGASKLLSIQVCLANRRATMFREFDSLGMDYNALRSLERP